MAIKMRVNNNKGSVCVECDTDWMHTPEMYDLHICGYTFTLCAGCVDKVFHKTLKAGVLYSQKIKSQTDMKRIRNSKSFDQRFSAGLSITEALRGIGEGNGDE